MSRTRCSEKKFVKERAARLAHAERQRVHEQRRRQRNRAQARDLQP
jgi:hypothetical protein